MIKKSIYPKTKRLDSLNQIVITEKIDGSNLSFFKKDGTIYIATREYILNTKDDLIEHCGLLYKGMECWLSENLNKLEECLFEGSVVCGEWIGMGKLKYPHLDKKFYMYAKANLEDDMTLKNINYNHELFKYCFVNQNVPDFIGKAPVVCSIDYIPSIENMDDLYSEYIEKENRKVEGFVICNNNNITKYVRMKSGKLKPHFS